MELDIAQIRIDGGTQVRAQLDQGKAAEYAEAMLRGEQFPDSVVFYDGENYWLADGFHRREGKILADFAQLNVTVKAGTRREAVLYAAGANSTHGLPRTNADKHRAVEILLRDEEWRNWSDRYIAEQVHVDHKKVADVRRALEAAGDIPIVTERLVERGGKSVIFDVAAKNERRQQLAAAYLMQGWLLHIGGTPAKPELWAERPSSNWRTDPFATVGQVEQDIDTKMAQVFQSRSDAGVRPDNQVDLDDEEDEGDEAPDTEQDVLASGENKTLQMPQELAAKGWSLLHIPTKQTWALKYAGYLYYAWNGSQFPQMESPEAAIDLARGFDLLERLHWDAREVGKGWLAKTHYSAQVARQTNVFPTLLEAAQAARAIVKEAQSSSPTQHYAPIVPLALYAASQQHPYHLPPIAFYPIQYATAMTVRLETADGAKTLHDGTTRSRQFDDVWCIPDDVARQRALDLYATYQQALDAAAAVLRKAGAYTKVLAAAGGAKKATKPLTPTVISAQDPDGDYVGVMYWSQWHRLRCTRKPVERHTPQMLVMSEQGNDRVFQRDHFLCASEEFYDEEVIPTFETLWAATDAWAAFLAEMGTYKERWDAVKAAGDARLLSDGNADSRDASPGADLPAATAGDVFAEEDLQQRRDEFEGRFADLLMQANPVLVQVIGVLTCGDEIFDELNGDLSTLAHSVAVSLSITGWIPYDVVQRKLLKLVGAKVVEQAPVEAI